MKIVRSLIVAVVVCYVGIFSVQGMMRSLVRVARKVTPNMMASKSIMKSAGVRKFSDNSDKDENKSHEKSGKWRIPVVLTCGALVGAGVLLKDDLQHTWEDLTKKRNLKKPTWILNEISQGRFHLEFFSSDECLLGTERLLLKMNGSPEFRRMVFETLESLFKKTGNLSKIDRDCFSRLFDGYPFELMIIALNTNCDDIIKHAKCTCKKIQESLELLEGMPNKGNFSLECFNEYYDFLRKSKEYIEYYEDRKHKNWAL